MANVTITQLPAAGPITGTELVPIVQNGQTVRTTTNAIASAPSQQQTFLTIVQEPSLPNSRYLSTGTGLGLADGGAQSFYRITLNGASGSLETAGNGLIAKTASNTVINRTLTASGAGLTVSDGDGVSGNPTVALSGLAAALANAGGTGMLAVVGGTVIAGRQIYGTTNQITIADGNGADNPVISIASDPIIPGTGAMTIPIGTNAQQPLGSDGQFRYNSDTQTFDGYASGAWRQFSLAGGVISFSAGSTGLTPSAVTTGAIVLGGILNPASGGTGVDNNAYTITLGGNVVTAGALTTSGAFPLTLTTTASTSLTLPVSGTLATLAGAETLTNKTINGSNNTLSNIGNGSLTNSSVTYNGVTVALGASGTITANTTSTLTIGTGLTGGSFNGSSPITITIDSTVATLSGSQTFTNKSISGATNTLSDIPNAALTNSSVTIGTTAISLGASSLTLGGLTSVAVTQDPTQALQLATKQYVDAVAEGLHVHASCAAATPNTLASLTGGTVTYNNGTAGVGATLTLSNPLTILDGYTLQNGNRILVKNEATQANNGIYTWATGGTVLTRATDFDTSTEIASGDFTFVTYGTLYANTGWVQIDPVATVGSDPIVWQQFSGAGTYTAGTGLTLTGSQFSITNTGVSAATYGSASTVPTIAVNAQGQITSASNTNIAIDAAAITSGTINTARISGSYTGITGVGTLTTGTWNATTIGVIYGGTGLTSYASGDLLYASGSTTLSKLAIGTSGQVLTAGAGAPQYVNQSTLSVGSATNATNATNTAITANSTNATNFLTFVSATSGNLPQLVNSSITCNPSTGQITGGVAGGSF